MGRTNRTDLQWNCQLWLSAKVSKYKLGPNWPKQQFWHSGWIKSENWWHFKKCGTLCKTMGVCDVLHRAPPINMPYSQLGRCRGSRKGGPGQEAWKLSCHWQGLLTQSWAVGNISTHIMEHSCGFDSSVRRAERASAPTSLRLWFVVAKWLREWLTIRLSEFKSRGFLHLLWDFRPVT